MDKAYKVFESIGDRPHFLYHGINGSRIVTFNQWLNAEIKWAKEGSNPYYWTAFHVYPSLDIISRWAHSVRNFQGRFVVEVSVDQTRPKPTRGKAILAEKILVTEICWLKKIELSEFKA